MNVIKRAKELILVQQLKEVSLYIKEMESIRGEYTRSSIKNNTNDDKQSNIRKKKIKDKVGLPEFESGSLAPKAKRMDQATPQALCRFCR